jgi:hypothetical protein
VGKLGVEALIIIALPIIVFAGGVWLMKAISGSEYLEERLQAAAEADRTPLNQRLHYDVDAVQRHWGALDTKALLAEQRFLKLDLAFPLLYGGALAFSLLMARAALGWTFSSGWLLAPVLMGVLADWTENLVQLSQIKHHLISPPLQADWIRVASLATLVKLVFVFGVWLVLVFLCVVMLVRAFKPS